MSVTAAPLPECTNRYHDQDSGSYSVTARVTDGPKGGPTGEAVTGTSECRDCASDVTDTLPRALVVSYDIPGYGRNRTA